MTRGKVALLQLGVAVKTGADRFSGLRDFAIQTIAKTNCPSGRIQHVVPVMWTGLKKILYAVPVTPRLRVHPWLSRGRTCLDFQPVCNEQIRKDLLQKKSIKAPHIRFFLTTTVPAILNKFSGDTDGWKLLTLIKIRLIKQCVEGLGQGIFVIIL